MITYEWVKGESVEPLPFDPLMPGRIFTSMQITSVQPDMGSAFSVTLDTKGYLRLMNARIPRKLKKRNKRQGIEPMSQKIKILNTL